MINKWTIIQKNGQQYNKWTITKNGQQYNKWTIIQKMDNNTENGQ